MDVKQCLSSSLILALVTGKHVSFITAGDELMEHSQVNKILSNYLIIIFVAEQRKKIISAQD
jgi:hypothetical protein